MRLDEHDAFNREIQEARREDDPLPRGWYLPLKFREARLVLENMGGDWGKYRRMPKSYRARLLATRDLVEMLTTAQEYDMSTRLDLKAERREAERGAR